MNARLCIGLRHLALLYDSEDWHSRRAVLANREPHLPTFADTHSAASCRELVLDHQRRTRLGCKANMWLHMEELAHRQDACVRFAEKEKVVGRAGNERHLCRRYCRSCRHRRHYDQGRRGRAYPDRKSGLDWAIGAGSVVTAAERFTGDATLATGGQRNLRHLSLR